MPVGVLLPQALPLPRRLHRRIDQRIRQKQHLDRIGVAPGGPGPAAHTLAIVFHGTDAAGLGDDRVGPAGSEILPARGTAGLADRWAALRRARRIQRAAAAEIFPDMVDRMHLAAV